MTLWRAAGCGLSLLLVAGLACGEGERFPPIGEGGGGQRAPGPVVVGFGGTEHGGRGGTESNEPVAAGGSSAGAGGSGFGGLPFGGSGGLGGTGFGGTAFGGTSFAGSGFGGSF